MKKQYILFISIFCFMGGMASDVHGQQAKPKEEESVGMEAEKPKEPVREMQSNQQEEGQKNLFWHPEMFYGGLGGGYGIKDPDTIVAAVLMQSLMQHIMSPQGVNLPGKLSEKGIEAAGEGLMWCAIAGGMSGFVGAMNKAVNKGSSNILDRFFSAIGSAWEKFKRVVFHNNAPPVTTYDINRWRKSFDNMLKGLVEVAEKAKASANIGQNMGLVLFNDLQNSERGEPEEESDAVNNQQVVDENWKENAQIYLNRILQIVREMEFRKKYYGAQDEIIVCLNSLIVALIGNAHMVIKQDGERELVWGGIYSRIANAQSLHDLASAQTATALQLFHKHLEGLLTELEAWVSAKENKQSSSSGSTYNSGSSYNYGGYHA